MTIPTRILLFLSTLSPLLGFFPVAVQNPVKFDHVEISLWPEYLSEGVLIREHFILNSTVKLPVQVSIPLPQWALDPVQVSYLSWDGFYYKMPYTISDDLSGRYIVINTSNPEFVVEFEDKDLAITDRIRAFTFYWKNDYPVEALTFTVYPPSNALDVDVAHAMGNILTVEGGIRKYSMPTMVGVEGKTYNTGFSYRLNGTAPLPYRIPVTSNLPPNFSMLQSKIHNMPISPYLLGRWGEVVFIVLLLTTPLLLIFAILLLSMPFIGNRSHSRSLKLPSGDPVPTPNDDVAVKYCPACGKRTRFGDRYCRSCGTQFD